MDKISSQQRSENMRAIRSKHMKPEMIVRHLVHSMGYRYRLHYKKLPGKPDLVFPSRKKVILVHGCFWHQHEDPECKIVRMPQSNVDYWQAKLERNRERDQIEINELNHLGWSVLTIWECETGDRNILALRIQRFLDEEKPR